MEPYFAPDSRPRKVKLRFSVLEVGHITGAVVLLSIAFTLVLNDQMGFTPQDALARFQAPWTLYLASLIAVSSGFVLHELGHKILAQHYGHWAEFRGQFGGLLASLAMAAGLGFLFAAPGAVLIWGRVTPKENGLISLMGPGVNFVIALLALPFTLAVDKTALLPSIMEVVAFVNAILCVFNLLPVGNLDGRKIMAWSKIAWWLSMGLGVALVIFTWILVGPL